MSSFLNRVKKNLKTGSLSFNLNDGDAGSIGSFDEEGFLCPICHRKFADTNGLEHHYVQAHSQSDSANSYHDTNGTKNSNKYEETEDSLQEGAIWKQQFFASEESRMQLSTELMQQRQRVGDLEEELESVRKQLHTTQMKVGQQSQEIGNLKATKDVYDAQIAMFTDELLNTQGELKEKQHQVDTLCNDLIPRPTNDDVDVLKRELITVQQRMNDMSLEKEQQIEILRETLSKIYESTKQLENFEETFNQNLSIYDELINNHTIESDIDQIKQWIHLTRQRKEKLDISFKNMRQSLNDNQIEVEELKQINNQLQNDLEHNKQSNEKLLEDFESEKKQTNVLRNDIEKFQNEIQDLEKTIEEIRQEKNQLLFNKIDGDQDDERLNLVKQLTYDKDQFEQQIKDLRKQIKEINDDKENRSQQVSQLENERNQLQNEQVNLNNEINLLKQQLNDLNQDKERQFNELTSIRDEYNSIKTKLENDLQQAHENHKQEIERLENEFNNTKSQLTEQINQFEKEKFELQQSIDQTKSQLETIENERNDFENQLQINQQTLEELQTRNSQLDEQSNQKNDIIHRLSTGIRRSIDLAHKTHQYIQEKIYPSQENLLTIIEQSQQDLQTLRTQTYEDIHHEFTNYLTVVHTIILDNKTKFEKQIEEENLKLTEEREKNEKQINQIQSEHNQLLKEYNDQKQNFEELTKNFSEISESLSQLNIEKENSQKQMNLLENELTTVRSDSESRIKKYEMQLTALTENLSTVRSELKTAQEKLIDFEKLKLEKQELETRLVANQDERQVLLERSVTSENRNEKLLLENGQLAKKNGDLEFALQEIAREYQSLQIQTNTISQRRWLNDQDVHACMKCNQTFTLTQRKHHCRSCGNIFCDTCSSKTAVVAAASKKPQRVCDQCYKELTS